MRRLDSDERCSVVLCVCVSVGLYCACRGIYCGITVVPDMYAFSGLKTFPIYFVTARAHLYGVYVNGNYV
jgi:hypothetical protein